MELCTKADFGPFCSKAEMSKLYLASNLTAEVGFLRSDWNVLQRRDEGHSQIASQTLTIASRLCMQMKREALSFPVFAGGIPG